MTLLNVQCSSALLIPISLVQILSASHSQISSVYFKIAMCCTITFIIYLTTLKSQYMLYYNDMIIRYTVLPSIYVLASVEGPSLTSIYNNR